MQFKNVRQLEVEIIQKFFLLDKYKITAPNLKKLKTSSGFMSLLMCTLRLDNMVIATIFAISHGLCLDLYVY